MTRTALTATAAALLGGMAGTAATAATLTPSSLSAVTASGSGDVSSPITDDVFLESLVFGTATYDAKAGAFSAAGRFRVLTGRSQINAEWGDDDDGGDGDDTPFAKAGFAGADQETTDPVIQDATLLNTFNSLSLSEITDGEGQSASSFITTFTRSLSYADVGGDALPDILFFERGGNDEFEVSLITGGTFDAPIFSRSLSIYSGDFAPTGLSIDTMEISSAQELYVGGYDLEDFGLGEGDTAYGFMLTTDRISAGSSSRRKTAKASATRSRRCPCPRRCG